MVVCDVCGKRRAVVLQRHTGRRLCKECFMEDVYKRVKREVERWNMFSPGDTLLLGLSGGKDSWVLLDTLTRIHDPSKIIAVTIIEGIPGYNREEYAERVRRKALEYGVDHVLTSIKEYTGYTLAEIVERAWARGVRVSPCTYCGIARRRILNFFARMYGASRTVTAHNLDDESQTAIINMLRGDWEGLLRQHPLSGPASPLIVPRVKPLRKIYEWETATYSYLGGFPLQETECAYIHLAPTLRARVRWALQRLEDMRPGTLYTLMETLDELLAEHAASLKPRQLPRCERCGEPTAPGRRLCKLCELLERAGIREPAYARWKDLLDKPQLLKLHWLESRRGGALGDGEREASAPGSDSEEAQAQEARPNRPGNP